MIRSILFMLAAASLAACHDSHKEAEKRDSLHSEAKRVRHKTDHAFRNVGGHLEKFFTGHDTISK